MTVLESLFAAWNDHKVGVGVELFADEMVFRDQALGQTHASKGELSENLHGSFAAIPDVKFELTNSFQQGRHIAGEVTMTGTRPGNTGEPDPADDNFTVQYGVIGELNEEGKITRLVEYWNPVEFTG